MNNAGLTLFSYHLLTKLKMRSPHLGIMDQMELVHQLTGVLNTLVNRIACFQLKDN